MSKIVLVQLGSTPIYMFSYREPGGIIVKVEVAIMARALNKNLADIFGKDNASGCLKFKVNNSDEYRKLKVELKQILIDLVKGKEYENIIAGNKNSIVRQRSIGNDSSGNKGKAKGIVTGKQI